QPAAPVAGQAPWNPPAATPAAPPVQSFDPPQPATSAPPQSYPPVAPAQYQQFQGQYPQMSQQPPMPNPAYGYPQPKSKIAAGLLGIFLGGLGIHRFYLGYTTIGVIQLVLTVLLGIFTFGLVGLWGFVEGIMILAGANYFQRDAKGIPLRD
ncbi:MAG TPA: NINE protein, partial [Arthrobacter sp.]|nr:NINE protein [Arthrobacter sp.]